MNIALVALATEQQPLPPPLTLAYVAAVLEQQRHIVRIYDLALTSTLDTTQTLRLLRTFRPQMVIVAGEQQDALTNTIAELQKHHTRILGLPIGRDTASLTQICGEVLTWVGQQQLLYHHKQAKNRGIGTVVPVGLGALPLPSRHLLVLERYGLQACGGELQTTLIVGQTHAESCAYDLRCASQIVNEMRAVAREHGVRHYRLAGLPLTCDIDWLQRLLDTMSQAHIAFAWEAVVEPQSLNNDLLKRMRQAGCETLRFSFDVSDIVESVSARRHLKQLVAQARHLGIHACAELSLEPPYDSIPHVVDVAATFGFDDVVFQVPESRVPQQREVEHIKAIAWQRYSVGRSRQHFIDRYGARLGAIVWNVRQSRLGLHLWGEHNDVPLLDERRDVANAA